MLINVSMQLDDTAVDAVKTKFFKNYKNWCKFLGRKHSLRYQATFYFHKWLEWDTFLNDVYTLNKNSLIEFMRRLSQGAEDIQQQKILYMGF